MEILINIFGVNRPVIVTGDLSHRLTFTDLISPLNSDIDPGYLKLSESDQSILTSVKPILRWKRLYYI